MIEHFQLTINRMEKNLNELKEAQREALKEGRQGQAESFDSGRVKLRHCGSVQSGKDDGDGEGVWPEKEAGR